MKTERLALLLMLTVTGLFVVLPVAAGFYRELRSLRQAVEAVAEELRGVRSLVPQP